MGRCRTNPPSFIPASVLWRMFIAFIISGLWLGGAVLCSGPPLDCRDDDATCSPTATLLALTATGVLTPVDCSDDGELWESHAATEPNSWYAVTYGNGQFVAVSIDGTNRIMTSSDGMSWTPRSAPEANGWSAITFGNNTFVSVASSGTNRIMRSTDGITWTPHMAPEANLWYGVAFGNNIFAAVANSGTNRVMS